MVTDMARRRIGAETEAISTENVPRTHLIIYQITAMTVIITLKDRAAALTIAIGKIIEAGTRVRTSERRREIRRRKKRTKEKTRRNVRERNLSATAVEVS
jgi:hypothetical protein